MTSKWSQEGIQVILVSLVSLVCLVLNRWSLGHWSLSHYNKAAKLSAEDAYLEKHIRGSVDQWEVHPVRNWRLLATPH